MFLNVSLQKEVDTIEAGETLFNLVVERLEDHPEVRIVGNVSKTLEPEEPG